MKPAIKGFLTTPRRSADSSTYRGRLVCPGVQWTGTGADAFATFTMTAEEVAAAAESHLLWTDQDVQRGIQPGLPETPPRELAVAQGYPDPKLYVFDALKADDIAEKLLGGEKLFLSPLVWNLRPDTFRAYWDAEANAIYLYGGRIYLPDSHHRHQGILKAMRTWREAPDEYPNFSETRQFKVELYFLMKDDEGNYFFEKNQLPKPTAKSKAFDLTTRDDLSLLAKRFIEYSASLTNNVNRVTDRLTARNPQVVTLSTVREMMRVFAATESVDSTELEGLATVAGHFYDMLAGVRPELALLKAPQRRAIREHSLVDSAVMMHGYAALMRDYSDARARDGSRKADKEWAQRLERLRSGNVYRIGRWSGDLFDKRNPLWQKVGIVSRGGDGRLRVLNTGAARGEAGRVLSRLLLTPGSDLSVLTRR